MPRLTLELLCRCTGHALSRRKDEPPEHFLARITHLYCSNRGIEKIENLHLCRNLSVLYLYDNLVSSLSGLSQCSHLSLLYLQNNLISRIQNITSLRRLTKLFLSHNCIGVLEGLEGLTQLSELHIAHQKLEEGEKLLFDPRTVKAISKSLTLLNVTGNRLDSIEDLICLSELEQFSASENNLTSMKELSKVLSRWPKLWKLELQGNPLSSKMKYHDRVVTMCYSLRNLDGREVSDTERQFLFSWKAMRKARRRQQELKPHFPRLEALEVTDSSISYLPPVVPSIPPRLPIRLQHLHQKRRHAQNQLQQESEDMRRRALEMGVPLLTREGSCHLPAIPPHTAVFQPFTSTATKDTPQLIPLV